MRKLSSICLKSQKIQGHILVHIIKRNGLFLLCLLFFSYTVDAQSKTKPASSSFQKLLKGTGLPVTIVNDSLAFIPYEGENISSYQVVVQRISDLYIIYTNLTESLPTSIDETKFKYLLQQNNQYDLIKIGLGDENILYLRADVYMANVSTVLIKRIIKQVANVTNIIAGELTDK